MSESLTVKGERTIFLNATVNSIAQFLEGIDIPVIAATLQEPTFLPGVKIERGKILIDESLLLYPGDMLHEAGHIAVMTPEERLEKEGDLGNNPGSEMAAIAWSYAALLYLGLEPEVVFHPDGYHGGSETIIENFRAGKYFGVPLLVWYGMTANEPEEEAYPKMKSWLRT